MENNEFTLFEPTETERTEMLLKLSDNVLIDNIERQINGMDFENSHFNNILKSFEEKFKYINDFFTDEITKEKSLEIKNSIYLKIYNGLIKRFFIYSELSEINNSDDFYFYTKELYNFFVIRYRDILINFFVRYIIDNKESLAKRYENETERKDLIFKNLKKNLSDLSSVLVIYHLETIINDFIDGEQDGNGILSVIISNDEYEASNYAMKELLLENKYNSYINKGFSEEFFRPFTNDEYNEELLSSIRNILLTKFTQNI